MKRVLPVLACLIILCACVGCIHKQLLLVTPYGDGDVRSAKMADALLATVKGKGFSSSIEVFNMDIERTSSEIWRDQMARLAVVRTSSFDPGMVFVADDLAAEYFAKRLLGTHREFIFLALKADPAYYGFSRSPDVTGIREILPIQEVFTQMKDYVPTAMRVAVISDQSLEGDAVAEQIRKATGLPLEVVAVKRPATLPEWMGAVAEVQGIADVLCVGAYRSVRAGGDSSDMIAPSVLLRMTAEANQLPDLSFWEDAVGPEGVMLAVTVPLGKQAALAANQAVRVMYRSERISSLRVISCPDRELVYDRERASRLGVKLPLPSEMR